MTVEAPPAPAHKRAPPRTEGPAPLRGVRVAYVVGAYPTVTHTFIQREVQALRARGATVETIAIHRPEPGQVFAEADAESAASTAYLTATPWRDHIRAHVEALRACGVRYVSALGSALRHGDLGLQARARQLAYFAEAVLCWQRCRARGITHLHGVFCGPASDATRLAAQLGGPGWSFSLAAHGTDIIQVSRRRLARKVERAAFVTCASHFGRAQLMALVAAHHWNKIEVVRCGVDLDVWRLRPGGEHQGFNILCVGRLEAEKGQRLLLDALADPRVDREVTLTLIGAGPERAALERRAVGLGIAERVRFLGPVSQDEIREHYAGADAFCLASLGEGVPVVLMEALAMELPVVAPRLMGIPELVRDRHSGLLFAPGDTTELAQALAELHGLGPAARAELGRAGRAMVQHEFDLARCWEPVAGLLLRHATPASERAVDATA